jgi:hypothetical protein
MYAAAVLVAALLHMTLLKWQPWGNRLLLYELVLAAPLAGLVLDRVLTWRPEAAKRHTLATAVVAGAVATALVVGASAGALAALYGWPRRLVGANSAFTLDASRGRFVTRPQWAADYAAVAAAVRASGARRIGLVQGYDSWEYPWWLELPGRHILPLQSNVLNHPATPLSDVDAVICVQSITVCQRYAQNWPVHMHGIAGYALRPAVHPPRGPRILGSVGQLEGSSARVPPPVVDGRLGWSTARRAQSIRVDADEALEPRQ